MGDLPQILWHKFKSEISQLIQEEDYSKILPKIDQLQNEIFTQKEPFKGNKQNISEQELTEQEKAKIESIKSEEKFKKLSDLSPSGISIQRKNKYFYVNKAWSEITGYGLNEIDKVGPFDIIHPEMHEFTLKSSDENLRKEGATLRYDLKIVTKDKKEKWLDISITSIEYEGQYATLALSNDITDIYKTREALRQSEEKFRKLTELSPAAICIQTTEKFLWANPAWSEITAYPYDELLKMGPLDIIHPDMHEIAKKRSDSRLKNEDVISRYNLKILTKDKKVKWVDIAVTVIQFEGQTASLAVTSDITTQVKAQQALKENEEKYRSLIENLRHEYFFYRHSIKRYFEYISPSIEQLLGYDQENFQDHYIEYLTDNPINKIAVKKIELAMDGIQQLPYELEIFDIQKNIHTLEISETPLIDTYGNVSAVEGIAHDITSQKKAQEIIKAQLKEIRIQNEEIKSINEEINSVNDDLERRIEDINRLNIDLKISENKFRTLVRNIPGVVYRCLNDKKWTMLFISKEIEILTGYSASDFIENSIRSFVSIIHPNDIEKVNGLVQNGVEKRKSYVIEYRILHKDGSIKWVYEKGQYILEENSIDVQFLDGVIIDITEKKIAEEKLKESENKLRELNAQKDRFFSLIAHDLRSPIGNFLQITELLKLDYEELEEDQVQSFFDNLHKLADRTFKLLENLLMWSRSQLGKLEIESKEIELYNVVEDVAILFEENLKSKGIQFKNELPQDLIVMDDLNIVQTLFRNLISNAIKFSYQGGSITIGSKTEVNKINDREYYIISVKDTGVGISPNNIDKIFNMDADYTTEGTEHEKGTGLGLILCKELIEKSGGKIWVGSEEGNLSAGKQGGTAFYFTLKR